MISIATKGLFWPQAHYGVWSDGGKLGVDGYGQEVIYRDVEPTPIKIKVRKITDRDVEPTPHMVIKLKA